MSVHYFLDCVSWGQTTADRNISLATTWIGKFHWTESSRVWGITWAIIKVNACSLDWWSLIDQRRCSVAEVGYAVKHNFHWLVSAGVSAIARFPRTSYALAKPGIYASPDFFASCFPALASFSSFHNIFHLKIDIAWSFCSSSLAREE